MVITTHTLAGIASRRIINNKQLNNKNLEDTNLNNRSLKNNSKDNKLKNKISNRIFNNNLFSSLIIGIISHFAMDRIPHRDYNYRAHKGLFLYLDLIIAHYLLVKLSKDKYELIAGMSGYGVDVAVLASNKYCQKYPKLSVIPEFHYKNHANKDIKSNRIAFIQQLFLNLIIILFLLLS